MHILIANVGNVRMNEIKALAQALNKKHKVTIACMAMDCSYRGLAFTFQDAPVRVSPLLYKDIIKNSGWVAAKDPGKMLREQGKAKLAAFDDIAAYEFYSNPADAVSIMMSEIMISEKPDLVICGINNGVHMGQDIYSAGNIGLAMEGVFFHTPSIAVAVEWKNGGHSEEELENAVEFIEKNVEKFASFKLPYTFLNINIPTVKRYKDFKGVKISRMGRMTQLSEYEEKEDVKGNKYYWAKKVDRANADREEWARTWFDKNYITIVPINYDATDHTAVAQWEKSIIQQMKAAAERSEQEVAFASKVFAGGVK